MDESVGAGAETTGGGGSKGKPAGAGERRVPSSSVPRAGPTGAGHMGSPQAHDPYSSSQEAAALRSSSAVVAYLTIYVLLVGLFALVGALDPTKARPSAISILLLSMGAGFYAYRNFGSANAQLRLYDKQA